MVRPFAVAKTAVLPPPPRMTHRLSLTFSTVRLSTDGCGGCCCAATTTVSAPARTIVPRARMRFMREILPDLTCHAHQRRLRDGLPIPASDHAHPTSVLG